MNEMFNFNTIKKSPFSGTKFVKDTISQPGDKVTEGKVLRDRDGNVLEEVARKDHNGIIEEVQFRNPETKEIFSTPGPDSGIDLNDYIKTMRREENDIRR